MIGGMLRPWQCPDVRLGTRCELSPHHDERGYDYHQAIIAGAVVSWQSPKIKTSPNPLPTLPGGSSLGGNEEERLMNRAMRTSHHKHTVSVLTVPGGVIPDDRPCEVPECVGVATHRINHLCCEQEYDLCPAHVDHLRGAFDTREARQMMCENCATSPIPRPSMTPFWML